jgi:CRISPR type III-A-associated RAMP protein Csm5
MDGKILKLETLSPLHIGSGEQYDGLTYRIVPSASGWDVVFYDVELIKKNFVGPDLTGFFERVAELPAEIDYLGEQKNKLSGLERKLKDIKAPSQSEVNQLRDVRRQLQEVSSTRNQKQRELSLTCFVRRASDNSQSNFQANFLRRVPAISEISEDSRIAAFLRTNQAPYIPGSEIKGAIRTAIFHHLLNHSGASHWKRNLLDGLTEFKSDYASDLSDLLRIRPTLGQRLPKWQEEKKRWLAEAMGKLSEKIEKNLCYH